MAETISFYLFAALAVGASALVIGQRNPMYSVMLLITSFGALAGETKRLFWYRYGDSNPGPVAENHVS